MKNKRTFIGCLLAALLLALAVGPGLAQGPQPPLLDEEVGLQAAAVPLGTGFTYQGQLQGNGNPVDGSCDFQFSLYDAATGGTPIGTQTRAAVPVSNGYFTVADLDFGDAAFQGDARWLAIEVRCPAGNGSYTPLSPRQALTAAPYALYAARAPWGGLIGIPAGFADGVDNDTTYTAGTGLTLAGTQFSLNTAFTDSRYWQLGGNSGTNPATHFLGTTDNQALELRVNNARALRLEPNTTSPNVIGGYSGNSATSGVMGAAIGGGGAAGSVNRVTDDYGTVGGGFNNRAGDNVGTTSDQIYATIGGGYGNVAHAGAAVGGGQLNIASGLFAAIGGGVENTAVYTGTTVSGGWSNTASHDYAVVGGGAHNTASGPASTVSGGWSNTASGESAAIGGGDYNLAAAAYATIAGGGPSVQGDPTNTNNRVTDIYGAIGGGGGNRAGNGDSVTTNAGYATIGGGVNNTASGFAAIVGGGADNTANGNYATIGGGFRNTASDYATAGGGNTNTASGATSTVGGGWVNIASGDSATIGGGAHNSASGPVSTVSGGWSNIASTYYATIGGGYDNTASGGDSTVGGGANNTASGKDSTVGGGWANTASAAYATIAGGGPSDLNDPTNTNNRVTDDYGAIGGGAGNRAGNGDSDTTNARYATVGGGINNTASSQSATVGGGWGNTASGNAATVPGGASNVAGGAYSFAAGAQAQATHNGSFVWSSVDPTSSWGDNTFTVRAHGGARFYSAAGTGTGVQLASGGGSWSNLSDRAAKENFAPVDGRDILDRLAAVPIQTWNYRSQDPAIRHIGPVAQDFYAAFGVGEDDTHITTVDADGVALAAIQGLYEVVQEKDARIAELEGRVAALEAQNAAQQAQIHSLEARLTALERQVGGTSAPASAALPVSGLALGGLALLGVVLRAVKGGPDYLSTLARGPRPPVWLSQKAPPQTLETHPQGLASPQAAVGAVQRERGAGG